MSTDGVGNDRQISINTNNDERNPSDFYNIPNENKQKTV